MIPILWRYLLQGYLKVFLLSVCTFVSVLIVSRFKEIARFAALSGDLPKTGLFLFYQIPFILPLAIPISALVSAFLLFQRLSRSCELVALRASGLSIRLLLTPLLFAALILSFCNFSFCADISPFCWRESKALLYRETSANPLLLMQRQNLVKIKNAYLKMEVKAEGKEAGDFILIAHNASSSRLNFISARSLVIANSKLLGYDFSILSHLHSLDAETFDPLVLENQAEMSTSAPVLSSALKKNRPRLEANALSLRMLRFRADGLDKHALGASAEILRRISLAAAAFTFTLLGGAFGMQTGRHPSKRWLFTALLLAGLALLSYLGLKEIRASFWISFSIAFLPHLLIIMASTLRIFWIARGKG
jgi:lipopolysaccharide export system permease protein